MYKNILVAIDDSDTSRCALNEALHIARSSKAKLYICHVADETLMAMHGRTFTTSLNIDNALQAIANAGRKLLDDALARATDIDAESVLLEAHQPPRLGNHRRQGRRTRRRPDHHRPPRPPRRRR